MQKNQQKQCIVAVIIFLFLGGVWGCDTQIDPLADSGERYFSLYGYLDSSSDTQFVRIDVFRPTPGQNLENQLDALVKSREVETGNEIIWQDSLVLLDDGSKGHLFFAPLNVVPGRTYEISVSNAQNQVTSAKTTLPVGSELEIQTPFMDVANDRFYQAVKWTTITEKPRFVSMIYTASSQISEIVKRHEIDYPQRGNESNNGWFLLINLQKDLQDTERKISEANQDSLALHEFTLHTERVDALWDANWTATRLPENVEKGVGFLGSVSRFNYSWQPDSALVRELGYRFPPPKTEIATKNLPSSSIQNFKAFIKRGIK